MKTKAPQFEFPTVSHTVFNLLVESAVDGERVQRELEEARYRLWEAKQQAEEQQPELI